MAVSSSMEVRLRPAARGRVLRTLVLASVASVVASACTEVLGDEQASENGPTVDGGELARADCPSAMPADGAECLLPEGTTCAFDLCSGHIARCTRGAWRRAGNPGNNPQCPDPPPAPGDPCPPCWWPEAQCTYGAACTSADAGERRALAQCGVGAAGGAGGWIITFEVCRDGGGPDVQGDAGADSG